MDPDVAYYMRHGGSGLSILALRRWRLENQEFKANLGYLVRLCLNERTTKEIKEDPGMNSEHMPATLELLLFCCVSSLLMVPN